MLVLAHLLLGVKNEVIQKSELATRFIEPKALRDVDVPAGSFFFPKLCKRSYGRFAKQGYVRRVRVKALSEKIGSLPVRLPSHHHAKRRLGFRLLRSQAVQLLKAIVTVRWTIEFTRTLSHRRSRTQQ